MSVYLFHFTAGCPFKTMADSVAFGLVILVAVSQGYGGQAINLLAETGVTCDASSTFDNRYQCDNVYDGVLEPGPHNDWTSDHEESGFWIQMNLQKGARVTSTTIWQRCCNCAQVKRLVFEYSDGSSQNVSRPCNGSPSSWSECDGQDGEIFQLSSWYTTYVKIYGFDDCHDSGDDDNAGFREIQIHGQYADPPMNLLAEPDVTCEASSTYDNRYRCDNAYDGVLEPGPHNDWTSDHETSGFWIQMNLPAAARVTSATVWLRCFNGSQVKKLVFVFSDASAQEVSRLCNGSTTWWDCDGQDGETFQISAWPTTYVKVIGYDDCYDYGNGGSAGFREIQIFGEYN